MMVDQTKNPHRSSKNYSDQRQDQSLGKCYNFPNPLSELLFPPFLLESPSLSYLDTTL